MNRQELERRLRREAASMRPAAPPELAARALSAIADDRAASAPPRARARDLRPLAAGAIPLAAGVALAVWLVRAAAPAPAAHAPQEMAARPAPARDPADASGPAADPEPDRGGLDEEFEALRSDLRAGGDLLVAALPQAPVAGASGRAR
jgi:hypothetical protein